VNLDNFLLLEEIENTINPIPTLESEIEDTTDLNLTVESEIGNFKDSITILLTDVSQTIQLMTKSLTNLFIDGTWKTQMYYYLRKLLDQHADPAIIKDFIERRQAKRKAKDTWH
ncbi:6392_t:CDS:2, partial [Cetraspora pellucida]